MTDTNAPAFPATPCRIALATCWRAFHDSVADSEQSDLYLLLSYLHELLARVAWLRNPARSRRESGRIRVRNALWVRGRLAWLYQFAQCKSHEEMRDVLAGHL